MSLSPNYKTDRFSIFRLLFQGWNNAFRDIQSFVDMIQSKPGFPAKPLAIFLISAAVTWFIYVPIHELLHVAGCIITGGTVTELTMGREYGADLLQHVFPFIVPETTQYAGRLTGFEPNGRAGYLVTDFLPFAISVFPGVALFLLAVRKRSLWLAGPGMILGLAPFMNLTGDYFEMGSIISTFTVNAFSAGSAETSIPAFNLIISDDIFRLMGEIAAAPASYGFGGFATGLQSGAAILLGAFLAVLFCGWTYQLGRLTAEKTILRPE